MSMARARFSVCVHCDLDLGNITLGQGNDTSLGHGQQMCEILSRSNLAVRVMTFTQIFGMCPVTLEIWPWVKFITTLGHGQQLCEILSRLNLALRSYGLDMGFGICALWLWRYDIGSRSKYWQDVGRVITACINVLYHALTELVCNLTELVQALIDMCAYWIRACTNGISAHLKVKVMTHPWVIDNNCVKYYPDQTSG